MIMNRPNATATSVHHFRFSSAKSRAFIRPPPLAFAHGRPWAGTCVPMCHKLVRATLATANRVVPGVTLPPVTEIVWRPPPEVVERANATRLVRRAGARDYRELVRRSAEELEWFWALAVED